MIDVEHALVVEDDLTIARSMAATLGEHLRVSRVDIAGTVARACEVIRGSKLGLVLLDLGLPDGDGFEVMSALELCSPRPAIVVITVFDDDDHLFEALRRGTDGYVLKEESGTDLARLLQEILDGRPPLSPSIARRILDQFREQQEPGAMLTGRERDVLRLLARGKTVARAAEELCISAHTVQHHVKRLYQKLDVHSRASMTRRALELGLV